MAKKSAKMAKNRQKGKNGKKSAQNRRKIGIICYNLKVAEKAAFHRRLPLRRMPFYATTFPNQSSR
jgi:hypothetical protein